MFNSILTNYNYGVLSMLNYGNNNQTYNISRRFVSSFYVFRVWQFNWRICITLFYFIDCHVICFPVQDKGHECFAMHLCSGQTRLTVNMNEKGDVATLSARNASKTAHKLRNMRDFVGAVVGRRRVVGGLISRDIGAVVATAACGAEQR